VLFFEGTMYNLFCCQWKMCIIDVDNSYDPLTMTIFCNSGNMCAHMIERAHACMDDLASER
jgi:hypothetical protein